MKYGIDDYLGFIKNSKLPQKSCTIKADGLNVLITGATSGVGRATALKYAREGANLILLIRNREKGESLKQTITEKFKIDLTLFYADFENLDELSNVLDSIKSEVGKIDILINNAGAYRTRKKILDTGIDSVYTVNHLAGFLILNKLIPLLVKGVVKRVINVNSEGHRFFQRFYR